jgi:phosphate transport system ATP-binding protein
MNGAFVSIRSVNAGYGAKQVLFDVDIEAPGKSIFALIGPSGCGKTTLLRALNRLNDLTPGFRLTGDIRIGSESVYQLKTPEQIQNLRRQTGMIFQQPNPLPMTVLQNMYFPYKEHYHAEKKQMRERALENLRLVGLLEELQGRLDSPAAALSGGQQQRLCIARALMLDTTLLLLDEPCSALDPISTFQIEDLLIKLKETHTIILVTHNMEQARRISDYTAFFYQGRVVEQGDTLELFLNPRETLTQKYLRGVM